MDVPLSHLTCHNLQKAARIFRVFEGLLMTLEPLDKASIGLTEKHRWDYVL